MNDMASFLISSGRCGKSERSVASWLRRCISYCDHVSMDVHTPTRDGTSSCFCREHTHTHTHKQTNENTGTERLFVDPVTGNDVDATGLSPENPLRSVNRAHDILKRARERRSKDEQSWNETSMQESVQNTLDADMLVTNASDDVRMYGLDWNVCRANRFLSSFTTIDG